VSVAWVAVGATVLGTAASVVSSRQASNAVSRGANSANAESARQFDTIRSDTAAQRALGQGATSLLGRLYGFNIPGANGAAPEQTVGTGGFKPSEVVAMLQRGMSINDILKLGVLTPNQGAKEFRYLQQNGLSPDQINQLIQGRFTPDANAPAAGSATAAGPDMSAFFTSPDYQFNLGEGQRAIDRSLAAQGRALSGAGVREGVRYASGMASNEYGNFINRLATLAGLGANATNTSANAGISTANTIGNNTMNAANARASSYLNTGETIGNAANGLASNYLLYRYLNPNTPRTTPVLTRTTPVLSSGWSGPRE
jgi:hypothetical protein